VSADINAPCKYVAYDCFVGGRNFVEVEAVGQQLRAIFQEYHPSKVPDVSRLLHKHAGRETAFLASVKHRYQLTAHSELVDAVAKGVCFISRTAVAGVRVT